VEIKFDKNENLWVVTFNAEYPLHVLTPQGVWHNFKFGNTKVLGAIEFDDFGKIWCQLINRGILVFDYGGTLGDPSDDDYHIINRNNSELPSNQVFCLKKDLDGDMWVGTANGPIIFECGDIFPEKNCRGSIRKVLEDSIPAPLLKTEAIVTIAVDGANRKWLGGSTGIYVQSRNGEFQEFRYTVDNSPLYDNKIIELEYDPKLGEMYIGTVKGVQSIRIDATGANQYFETTNLYTFPNPVRPGWEGPIAIQGLAEDANVKITDMQGRLVYESTAKGGLMTWNGYDYSGHKAKAGVYLVYATYVKNLDKLVTETTKFIIME
jgi:ligand-binding sensor domain-containing protein